MAQYINVSRYKNEILDVGYDSKGKKYKRSVYFEPHAYIQSNKPNTDVRSIYGDQMQMVKFDSLKDYYSGTVKNSKILQGAVDGVTQYIYQTYKTNDISIKLNVMAIDIEVYSEEFPEPEFADHEINSVSMHMFKTGMFYQLSLKNYSKTKNQIGVDPDKIIFKHCKDETELLNTMINIIGNEFPDVLLGYYSNGFDFPYIINRCNKILGTKRTSELSPFGVVSCRKSTKKNKLTKKDEVSFNTKIAGIVLLDFQELYKKYIFTPRESYSLDFIAQEELGESKVDYSEYDSLTQLWENDPQKYIDYNIVDTKLLKELDDKLGLIELNASIAYLARCNIDEALSTVRPWESYLYNVMMDDNICLPAKHGYKKESYPGAYVKDPIPGLYGWLISFDYSSLYPNLMRSYEISPEKYIKQFSLKVDQTAIDDRFFLDDFKNPNPQYIITGSGHYFKREGEGIIPRIIRGIYDERKATQKLLKSVKNEYNESKNEDLKAEISQLHNKQMAFKIFMNSLYGAMANENFIFYNIDFARSITLSGQLQIKFTENYLNKSELFQRLSIKSIYCDTDSVYLDVNSIAERFEKQGKTRDEIVDILDKFANEHISPLIVDACTKLSEKMCSKNLMNAERELIGNAGIWLAPKKYAVHMLDKSGERYSEPKLKVTGIEIVRSSTPAVVKPFLREILKKILNKEDIVKYLKNCKKEYLKFTPEQMAFPRSANNISGYYKEGKMLPGIPIGVRSAVVFNKYIDDNKLESQFAKIQSGNKIKFLYTKLPNPTGENVLGFLRRIPEALKKFTDIETMWEKSFYSVVTGICDKIGIEYKEKNDMNELF